VAMNNAAGSAERLHPGVVVRDTREIGSLTRLDTRRKENWDIGYYLAAYKVDRSNEY